MFGKYNMNDIENGTDKFLNDNIKTNIELYDSTELIQNLNIKTLELIDLIKDFGEVYKSLINSDGNIYNSRETDEIFNDKYKYSRLKTLFTEIETSSEEMMFRLSNVTFNYEKEKNSFVKENNLTNKLLNDYNYYLHNSLIINNNTIKDIVGESKFIYNSNPILIFNSFRNKFTHYVKLDNNINSPLLYLIYDANILLVNNFKDIPITIEQMMDVIIEENLKIVKNPSSYITSLQRDNNKIEELYIEAKNRIKKQIDINLNKVLEIIEQVYLYNTIAYIGLHFKDSINKLEEICGIDRDIIKNIKNYFEEIDKEPNCSIKEYKSIDNILKNKNIDILNGNKSISDIVKPKENIIDDYKKNILIKCNNMLQNRNKKTIKPVKVTPRRGLQIVKKKKSDRDPGD